MRRGGGLRAAAAGLAAACCLSMGGCSMFGLDARSLMRPPRPSGDKAGVYDLLEKQGGASFSLRYPAAGGYRSAIIEHDLNGDGGDEAVAFYQKTPDDTATQVLFCARGEDGWRSVGLFQNPASRVDRVCFGDLDGDGSEEAVVGWGSSTSGASAITVYREKDGKMSESRLDQTYNEMVLHDFDGDGSQELFTAGIPADGGQFTASLFRMKENTQQMIGSVALDAGAQQFSSIQAGQVAPGVPGVAVDCLLANSTSLSELFYWDAKTKSLCAPLYSNTQQNITQRSVAVNCTDVDADGVLDFPVVSRLPGYQGAASDDVGNAIQWTRMDSTGDYKPVSMMLQNAHDGYAITLPDVWKNTITTRRDASTHTLTVCAWDKTGNRAGAPLLQVQSFSVQAWQSGTGTAGYTQMLSASGRVVAAMRPAGNGPLFVPLEKIQPCFQNLAQES